MLHRNKISTCVVSITLLFMIIMPMTTLAESTISHEVKADEQLPVGTIVSLRDSDPAYVELASTSNGEYVFGVVVEPGETLIEIDGASLDVPVATNGDVSVVVSTINGNILIGDIVTVSTLNGVGAKASADNAGSTTIGVALENFSVDSASARTVSASSEAGGEVDVVIGTIPVRLAINDFFIDQAASSSVVVSIAETLVGKEVSNLQAVISSVIVIVSVLIGGSIIWSAIHGSFISIGRNPLASTAVFNSMFYVTMLSLAIMVGGFVAAYLTLLF